MKKALQYLIIFSIGAVFLYFTFKGIAWNDLWDKIKHCNPSWLIVGIGISIFSHFIRAWRATQFYSALGYKIGNVNSYLAVMIGYMMNYFIPRAGEVSRCAVLKKTDDLPVDKSLGTVIAERTFDLIILIIILGLVFFLQFDLIWNYIDSNLGNSSGSSSKTPFIAALTISGLLLFAIFWVYRVRLMQSEIFQKLWKFVSGFLDGLLSFRKLPHPGLFLFQSALIWLCYILMMYFCLFALDATSTLDFSACLTVFALGTIGVVIPAPGAGAGTYHFAIMQSLLLYGVKSEDGIAYATLVHGAQMILLIALGSICSVIVMFRSKKVSHGIE